MANQHLTNLTHATFKCNKFEETLAFYRDTLGLHNQFTLPYTQEMIDSNPAYACFRTGDPWITYMKIRHGEFIELLNVRYPDKYKTKDYSFMHVCLLVDDIVACARHLESKGITLWAGPKYAGKPYTEPYPGDAPGLCGSLAFYIQDPEGNEIEIMQYTENSLQLRAN